MAKYEQIRVLGEGSFGKVYLMRQRDERQLVCVKVIKIKNIPRKEREACKMEVDLLRRLNHPNIVGYRESFVHLNKESLCIVMQVRSCHFVVLALGQQMRAVQLIDAAHNFHDVLIAYYLFAHLMRTFSSHLT